MLGRGAAGFGALAGIPLAGAAGQQAGTSNPLPPTQTIQDLGWANVRDHGASGTGQADDSPAIQAAIDSGASVVYLPPGQYRLDQPLDLTNREENPIALIGSGTSQTGQANAATLLANTGTVALDTLGSQYVTLRGFRVYAETMPNPSTVGILMGRSRDRQWAQFHRYDDLMIFLPSRPSASPRGTIGIYNVGAEHWYAVQVRCIADLPFAMAATDVLEQPSPFAGPHGGPTSMTICDLNQTTAGAWTQAAYEFWNAQNIQLNHVYTNRLPGNSSIYPFRFNTDDTAAITISGQAEEWPGVALLEADASGMHFDCVAVGSTAPHVRLRPNVSLEMSTIRIKQIHGAVQSVVAGGRGSRLRSPHITLFPNQRLDAPNVTLTGGLILSHDVRERLRLARGSNYLHLSENGPEMVR